MRGKERNISDIIVVKIYNLVLQHIVENESDGMTVIIKKLKE